MSPSLGRPRHTRCRPHAPTTFQVCFNGCGKCILLLLPLRPLTRAGRESNSPSHSVVTPAFHRPVLQNTYLLPRVCLLYDYLRGPSILDVVVWVDDCVIVDNASSLRNAFALDPGRRFPVDANGILNWILQVKVIRDQAKRILTLPQELYMYDLVHRYDHLFGWI